MPDSPLDEIIKQVQINDIAENRLILFKRFLDAELFILIDNPEDPKPKLMNLTEGQILLGGRDVPVDNTVLGESVKENEPIIRQVLIQRGPETLDSKARSPGFTR